MKRILKALLLGFVLAFVISQTIFIAECEDISNRLLRLHILANSDSEEDQKLKLKVRDYILDISSDMFSQADNLIEAEHIAKTNLDLIVEKAQKYVYSLGYDYTIQGQVREDMYFNTREYDNFILPAGNYDALRITIGEGEGHNWWCVMFPPMCFSIAEENNSNLSDILNNNQLAITEKGKQYEYKFKIVEIYNDIKNFFRGTK
ncbi:MAG: stage II sporulation protein R [Acutalibacteraceae bacterium]|nr:stage II sporulation protein R [Acutalibacteraceae bacterium]